MKVEITPEMLRRWETEGDDETTLAGRLSPVKRSVVSTDVVKDNGVNGHSAVKRPQPSVSSSRSADLSQGNRILIMKPSVGPSTGVILTAIDAFMVAKRRHETPAHLNGRYHAELATLMTEDSELITCR